MSRAGLAVVTAVLVLVTLVISMAVVFLGGF